MKTWNSICLLLLLFLGTTLADVGMQENLDHLPWLDQIDIEVNFR